MEQVDYTSLIEWEPPEGIKEAAIRAGRLKKEFLIYRDEIIDIPLEDHRRHMARVTCSACGDTWYAEKVSGGACAAYQRAPFGFQLPDGTTISGEHQLCPNCGVETEAKHVGAYRDTLDQHAWVTSFTRVAVDGRKDRLVLIDWVVIRGINKQAESRYSVWPWTAWVIEEKKLIRIMGHKKIIYTETRIKPEQRKRFLDEYGEAEALLPLDPALLDGTTAENCKLDRFIEQGGKYLISYLALWRKHPNAENLIMMGMGRLVNELIDGKMKRYAYEKARGIPKIQEINWKKARPTDMMGLTREELRKAAPLDAKRLRTIQWAHLHAIPLKLPMDALRLEIVGYEKDIIFNLGGSFWRTVGYLERQGQGAHILRDYRKMMQDAGADMTSEAVLWPKRLKDAHDAASKRIKLDKLKKYNPQFLKRARELSQMAWEKDGILIRPCATTEELLDEGNRLNHCVASYAERIAQGKTAIFFIRRGAEPDQPWYTLELNEKTLTVRQNRGNHNCERVPEVREFEAAWLEHIRKIKRRDIA